MTQTKPQTMTEIKIGDTFRVKCLDEVDRIVELMKIENGKDYIGKCVVHNQIIFFSPQQIKEKYNITIPKPN